jgi:hypothetical protein
LLPPPSQPLNIQGRPYRAEVLPPWQAREKLPLFNYGPEHLLAVNRGAQVKKKHYFTENITFVINDPLGQLGVYRQELTYYRSLRPGPRPAVIIFPPFLPQKIEEWSAGHFAKKGYDAFVISPAEDITDTSRPLDRVDDMFIRSVIAARMTIDLMAGLPEIDASSVYGYGISLGGIKTALTFGVEPRVKKALEIVGGGDLAGVIANTHFKLLRDLRNARMQAEGLSDLTEFQNYMDSVMTVDPIHFALLRDPRDLHMVIGMVDRIVPAAYQEKLYVAYCRGGKGPVVTRSLGGHYHTALKFKRYINRFVAAIEGGAAAAELAEEAGDGGDEDSGS